MNLVGASEEVKIATVKRTPFELTGCDGQPLRGEIWAQTPGDQPAVIVCHGFKGFKDWGFFPPLAQRLSTAGLAVVTFNFSGSGVGTDGEFSELWRFTDATHSGDLEDLRTVLSALRSGGLGSGRPPSKLGLLGHSRGGGTSILQAAREPDLSALVTWSAVSTVHRWSPQAIDDWRAKGSIEITNARTGQIMPISRRMLDDIAENGEIALNVCLAAADVRAPWLIAHGVKDEMVTPEHADKLWSASKRRARKLLVENGSHTFGAKHPWNGMTVELQEVMDATVEWFVRHLF